MIESSHVGDPLATVEVLTPRPVSRSPAVCPHDCPSTCALEVERLNPQTIGRVYGAKDNLGCRENFLSALKSLNLDWKDIVPNVNFFCNVPVYENGKLAESVFAEPPSRPGDFVDLRAEMDALAILSNCPQVNNPCNASNPTPIRIMVWEESVHSLH